MNDNNITYDSRGNIIKVIDEDLEINNTYDENNNLIRTEYSNGYWAEFEYDNEGYLTYYRNSNRYDEGYRKGKIIAYKTARK